MWFVAAIPLRVGTYRNTPGGPWATLRGLVACEVAVAWKLVEGYSLLRLLRDLFVAAILLKELLVNSGVQLGDAHCIMH